MVKKVYAAEKNVPANSFMAAVEPARQFVRSAQMFWRKSTKPKAKEYKKICQATSIGFLVMGFIGYFVKLIHIPINNIIVGAHASSN